MKCRMVFISEALSAPFDEGFKNVVLSVHLQLQEKIDSLTVTKAINDTSGLNVEKIDLNKLFINNGLRLLIKSHAPDIILYIPSASHSIYAFLRAKILKLIHTGSKVVLLGMQHREYSFIKSAIMTLLLKPDLLLLIGNSDREFFLKKGIRVSVLPPAINIEKFYPATEGEKKKIRAEYNIPDSKKLFLHVGHIKTDRNINSLLEVQKIENAQVVIVGSTSTSSEKDLKDELVKSGILVIDTYMPDISKAYQMSDVYIFPVLNNGGAIEMPLSVLEAMACNLPVITTRFGALIDYFEENDAFKYYDSVEELAGLAGMLKNMDREKINNRNKVKDFTWSRFCDEIITACNGLA